MVWIFVLNSRKGSTNEKHLLLMVKMIKTRYYKQYTIPRFLRTKTKQSTIPHSNRKHTLLVFFPFSLTNMYIKSIKTNQYSHIIDQSYFAAQEIKQSHALSQNCFCCSILCLRKIPDLFGFYMYKVLDP